MIIVDSALAKREEEGKPVRLGMIGAGFMARGIAVQVLQSVPGMELVAIANRSLSGARRAYAEAGDDEPVAVNSVAELEQAIEKGRHAITEDPYLLCSAGPIDAILEVTGAVEHSAGITLSAIENGKHVILMNAELDSTVGPILKKYADSAGVVLTNVDGDQPGVIMNLYRFVRGIGVTPMLCGNIKGLQDRYRNPTTQEGFAKKWGQNPEMVTSFADGTKISFEQAIVANATGMTVGKRGMYGPTVSAGTHVSKAHEWYPEADLLSGPGIVDYVVQAEPGPGVFVLGLHENPIQKHYLNLYKLGEGPLYCYYTPYHLCHFEAPMTVARAVLFDDATIAPIGPPLVDVVATAKIDLDAGQVLDGIGCYMTYGQAETAQITWEERLLPMGLAEGARLKRSISKDEVLSMDDVELPAGRVVDRLRTEQNERFFGPELTARVREG